MLHQGSKQNTQIKDGKAFEHRIFNLLKLNGAEALTAEKQFRTQKPDMYFEREILGKRRRYAVECKDYSETLAKSDLSAILSRYEGMFEDKDITDLLVVSNERLSPGGQSYVDAIPYLTYQTESDLRNSVIDLTSHSIGILAKFEGSNVGEYYIAPHGKLFDQVGSLLHSTPGRFENLEELLINHLLEGRGPAVVLGAYGIGKTTLALKIFSRLAKKHEEEPESPIPIYIPLDLMQREQSLDGLLGTVFTSLSQCKGYNYEIFRKLNKDGNFIVLLDGFDEMRHKLNREDFLHNIDQLSQLSNENPRTLLLGRPSAFMDESEYEYVVRGRSSAHPNFTIAKYSGYEAHVLQMDAPQIAAFSKSYCDWKYPDRPQILDQVASLLSGKNTTALKDIVSRPVQLMMFLEIFPQLPKRIDSVTKATVYSLFIEMLIDREKSEKRSRIISKADQLKFAQKIAWWLWLSPNTKSVRATEIPDRILEEFVKVNETIEDVRRTLVAGSFLSSEGGTRVHFPHNSIQEYLVASKFCDALAEVDGVEGIFNALAGKEGSLLTPDVVDFIAAQIGKSKMQNLLQYMVRVRNLPQSMAGLLNAEGFISSEIAAHFSRTGNPRLGWLLIAGSVKGRSFAATENATLGMAFGKLVGACIDRFARDRDYTEQQAHEDVASYLLCIFALSSARQYSDRSGYVAEALEQLVRFGRPTVEKAMGTRKKTQTTTRKSVKLHPFAVDFLNRLKQFVFTTRIDVQWVYKYLLLQTRGAHVIQEWIFGDTLRLPNQKLRSEFDLNAKRDFLGIKRLAEHWNENQFAHDNTSHSGGDYRSTHNRDSKVFRPDKNFGRRPR